MAVSYKKLQHLMIDRNISNAELMRRANRSSPKLCVNYLSQNIELTDLGDLM